MIKTNISKINDNSLENIVIGESDLPGYLSEYEELNRNCIIRCSHCNALLSIANKTKNIHYRLKRLSSEESITE